MQRSVLVIGSGVAGLTYALKVAEFAQVRLITKKENTESNTNYAQGGIAAVMSADDSPDLHIEDTLTAGAGLCHLDAVEQMVREGPDQVRQLIEWGARFSLHEAESQHPPELALGREGGHSRNRIVHAKDLTGREVERTLSTAVQRHRNIRIEEHHAAIDLVLGEREGRQEVLGATVLDTRNAVVRTVLADATVLATGGAGHVYLHTTNPSIATGDGVAMAWRAGARVGNMEFIQFHPTTLFHPDARSFLISEAVRGEGGILRLRDGTPFMDDYHPLASLAPRDIVARAIDTELKRSGDDFVYLDVTHLEPEFVRDRFPHIYKSCLEFGLDITREPIPIVPAAHYSCGGILTDLEGRSSLHRLYAVGEVACTGVHGANRLASNSLLEALVFADHAAADTRALLQDELSSLHPCPPVTGEANHPDRLASEVSPEFIAQLRLLTQTLMWAHVGIVRTDRRLKQAHRELELLRNGVESLYDTSRITTELLELRNIIQVGWLIIECALQRKESRGLHFNSDYPERDDVYWLHDTTPEPAG
ncbi:MAG: L-aspartate oxidase [Armatimonadetes bacterium]|jgi:L-aspartate oxidase|nr:L-aspartate oxidase [Armatimonadota bacterium]